MRVSTSLNTADFVNRVDQASKPSIEIRHRIDHTTLMLNIKYIKFVVSRERTVQQKIDRSDPVLFS